MARLAVVSTHVPRPRQRTPMRYVARLLTRRTLAGLYRIARVGVVLPLRDGTNLVASDPLPCAAD